MNNQTNCLVDNVERLRSISYLNEKDWLDLLEMSWRNYQQFKMGFHSLNNASIDNLSEYYKIDSLSLLMGDLNFKQLALNIEKNMLELPESYITAQYSRRRTTITSIEYVEKAFGWRLKQDVLKHFGIKESALQDPFAKINVKLIIQICEYLKHRQFSDADIFMMGAYSFIGNKNSLLQKSFVQMNSVQDMLTFFFNEMTPLFEINSTFNYVQLNASEGLMTMKSVRDIANELGVKHLGSPSICMLKAGIGASVPAYVGLPFARVTHTTCEHRGDDACRFHFDVSPCLNHKKA